MKIIGNVAEFTRRERRIFSAEPTTGTVTPVHELRCNELLIRLCKQRHALAGDYEQLRQYSSSYAEGFLPDAHSIALRGLDRRIGVVAGVAAQVLVFQTEQFLANSFRSDEQNLE